MEENTLIVQWVQQSLERRISSYRWALERLVWAVPAGLLLGFVLGRGVGRVAIRLRSRQRDTGAPSAVLVYVFGALVTLVGLVMTLLLVRTIGE